MKSLYNGVVFLPRERERDAFIQKIYSKTSTLGMHDI
jgi:hypothetical protein